MIGFIGTDLDGTLLDDQQSISVENVRAIRLAVSKGIKFGMCTGRTLHSVDTFFNDVLQIHGFKILLNGAVVLDPDNNKIVDRPMDSSVVDDLLSQADGYGFKVVINGLDSTYLTDPKLSRDTYYEGVSKKNVLFSSVDDLRRINQQADEPIYKVSFSSTADKAFELQQKIESYTSMPVTISRSGELFYEINSLDCSKFSALQDVSEAIATPISDFLCFGDYGNDLAMIQGVGYGVAMQNAIPEIKKVADIITDTNINNGVAKVINQLLLSQK